MKYIYFILFFSLMSFSSMAQSCEKEDKPTSTDWRKYDKDKRDYPNDWNWTLLGEVHPVYTQQNRSSPNIYVELPYFCTKVQGSGGCNNSNTSKYEDLFKQDIYPEDGWELLIKDFGTPNKLASNGDIISRGRGQSSPYFILYNKYNGRMKVFYAIVGPRSQNSSYLNISFTDGSRRRSVFAHVTPVAQILEEFYPSNNFKILNDYAYSPLTDDYYWLVSEVQASYDPCTCTDSIGFKLSALPVLVTTTTIEAKIEGQIKQATALVKDGKVKGEADGTTSFGGLLTGAVEAGSKSYTNYEKFSKQATTFLDSRNNAYKEKLVKDWWEGNRAKQYTTYDERESAFL